MSLVVLIHVSMLFSCAGDCLFRAARAVDYVGSNAGH